MLQRERLEAAGGMERAIGVEAYTHCRVPREI